MVSFAALSADEIANAAADKPILAANNALGELSAGQWVANSLVGDFGDADDTATGFPVARAFDEDTTQITRGTGTDADHTLVFDFGTAGIEFDFFAIGPGHNLVTDANPVVTMTVQVADDSTFATNLRTIATFTPSVSFTTDRRFAELELFHTGSTALRYSDVQFARVTFDRAAGGTNIQVSELIFGRRAQLRHQPNNPGWDPDALFTNRGLTRSRNGKTKKITYSAGGRTLDANWTLNTTAVIDDVQLFRDNTNFYARQFVWIDLPNSEPNNFNLMDHDRAQFGQPFRNFVARSFAIRATEQGPDYLSLGF